ncbi:hypothetical protein DL765_000908 [Monosporascus sp. GIB2]|nr:hypothetical protein DL765_000908 [Monosporascus sp. GIB2]
MTTLIETVPLEHVPATHSVHVAVFRDVANSEFLQQQLLSRNPDFEYAFIDASSVISRLQVLSAVYKAITMQLGGNMKTSNIHSEIVCLLSPTNNIAEAYRRYGITPSSRDIIIVKVLIAADATSAGDQGRPGARDVEAHLREHVEGTGVPFSDEVLSGTTDWAKVRKYYKLNSIGWLDGIKDESLKRREMEMLVLGSMALRGV